MFKLLSAALLALALSSCAAPSGDMGTAMGKAAAELLRR